MRQSVDSLAPRPGWHVAHAESEMAEIKPSVLALGDPEYEP